MGVAPSSREPRQLMKGEMANGMNERTTTEIASPRQPDNPAVDIVHELSRRSA